MMWRNFWVLAVAALVVALPFVFRRDPAAGGDWRPGDPEVVVISPHNEAIRYEFGRAFAAWHRQHYGRPAKVDWRNIGGTTEIMRYLNGSYTAAFRAWWKKQGRAWPANGGTVIMDARFNPAALLDNVREQQVVLHREFRAHDDPAAYGSGVDLLFGGGSYDHDKAVRQGMVVPPWPSNAVPRAVFENADGTTLCPEKMGGEIWRTPNFFGCALSTFGICYNMDRLVELGLKPPSHWTDLADFRYAGVLGVADPTKSGSIAKAFEMIIHEQCRLAVGRAGFTDADIRSFERKFAAAGRTATGGFPDGVPAAYQQAVEDGWLAGVRLVQQIGANARYFTDSSSKVPIDVSMGEAAAGIAIDFYGRFQAEISRAPDGRPRMAYLTPVGGSSVSADPVCLLRGAPHRETAVRFIEFALSEAGQKLWNYRVGAPGGPEKFALRRLPVGSAFYPPASTFAAHAPYTSDNLADPSVNAYALAAQFEYQPRWTGGHFSIMRDLVRAMCMDSGEELKAAWRAIHRCQDPARRAQALAKLQEMPQQPEPLAWESAPRIGRANEPLVYMRLWTAAFRANYREAQRLAEAGGKGAP
jgi:iron(III) transport system substrate-binding protein